MNKTKITPEAIVRDLTRKELQSFVLAQLEADNGGLASALLARFGMAEGKGEWQKLIRQCRSNRSANCYGVVDDVDGLAWDIEELKTRAKALRGKNSSARTFDLYTAILEVISPDIYEFDDHDGVLINVVSQTLGDILALAKGLETGSSCLSTIKAWARANIESKWAIDGDSWDFDLFEIELATAREKAEFESSLQLCESKCIVPNPNDYHGVYLAENLAKLVCTALVESGDDEGLQSFIERHIDLTPVRDAAIQHARNSQDLITAERLAREGMILSLKQGFAGTRHKYATEILSILDERGDPQASIDFVVSLTISDASIEWYKEIVRRVSDPADRKPITDQILATMRQKNSGFTAEVFAVEQRWQELHSIAVRNTSIMHRYYCILGPHFPESVSPWLEKVIRNEFKTVGNRIQYRMAASRISELRMISGLAAAKTLVNELVSTYSNRPAMIDELHKVLQ